VNFALLTPEFILAGAGIVAFVADFLVPKARRPDLGWLALFGLIVALAVGLAYRWGRTEALYGGLFKADAFSLYTFAFLVVIGGAVVVASMDYVRRHIEHAGEYYGLLVLSVLGMVLLPAAGELLTAYVALELLTFSLYVMVSLERRRREGNEAGTKYIVLGALSSAVLLYGISLVWGALGTTTYAGMAEALRQGGSPDVTLIVGLALILAGIGFKVAAVPLHMWAPDVYQGAPTPVVAYLAIGSKAAVFVWVLRLMGEGLMPLAADWRPVVVALSAATIVLGNLVAIVQHNVKRLLAYSSIGQAGYVLAGVAALAKVEGSGGVTFSTLAANGILLHLVGYALSTLAVFLVVIVVYNHIGSDEMSDYGGLAKLSPLLAMVLAAALFSLAGLPFFAGFTTKFYLFTAVADSGLLWLAGLGVVGSLVSLYYYLRWLKAVYIDDAPGVASEAVRADHAVEESPLRPSGQASDGGRPAQAPSRPEAVPALAGRTGPGAQAVNELTPIALSRAAWVLLAGVMGGMILVGVWPVRLTEAIVVASRWLAR
jgi:NADH-quinone oxidoreductase subunit N